MSELKTELKTLIIESLNLEDVNVDDIKEDEALFGEGLGLDSIDALELGLAIYKKYNVKFNSDSNDSKMHFKSINALADYIQSKVDQGAS